MRRVAAVRRAAAALAVVTVTLVPATPAGADPARPTNFRSEVLRAEPSLPDGVSIEVVGGDAFLSLSVGPGHRVVVPDYTTEGDTDPTPYLRFDADGTVRRNRNAVATSANETRYGQATTTPNPDAPPDWEQVASGGTYAWHDHRTHWMSPNPPRAVAADGTVDLGGPDGTWEVPIVVDGTPTVVVGRLRLLDAPPWWPWMLVVAATGAAVVLAGTWAGPRWADGAAALVALGASGVAWAGWRAIPAAAGGSPLGLAVVLVSLAAALAALIVPPRLRLGARAAAAAGLVGWSVTRLTVLSRAVLPTSAPFVVDRAATATALGAGLGLAVLLVWAPARGRPPRRAGNLPGTSHAA